MNIFLKSLSMQSQIQSIDLVIKERLPICLELPCKLHCEFYVCKESDYYLLHIEIKGMVNLTCQRCLQGFPYLYKRQVILAVCADEATAERLMNQYECIVTENEQVDILEVVTDDLYLFLPEKHLNLQDCDREIRHFIHNDFEAIS